jgi:LCP family protein required for cell wall assembly
MSDPFDRYFRPAEDRGNEPASGGSGSAAESSGRRELPPELSPRRTTSGRGSSKGHNVSTPGPAPTSTQPPGPPRRRGRRIAAWVAGSLALLVVVVSAVGYGLLNYTEGKIKRVDVFGSLNHRPAKGDDEAVNYLLVGSDSREGLSRNDMARLHVGSEQSAAGRRADTMILVHISKQRDKATLLSFPRDLYVTIPAHTSDGKTVPERKNKLNAAFSFGGPSLAIETIEQNTGLRIDHYLEVNFLGFTKMVDAVGGVDICTAKPLKDHESGLDLTAGPHKLDGEVGLKYVRARHLDGRADLGRIERQQEFLGAMMRKATSSGVLLNPVKLAKFVNAGLDSMTTDEGLSRGDMITLASKLRSLSPQRVTFVTVPIGNPAYRPGGGVGAVALADENASTALYDRLRADEPVTANANATAKPKLTVRPAQIRVSVQNGAGVRGLGARAAADLEGAGFAVRGAATNAATTGATQTVIRYDARYSESAKTLAAALPGSKLVKVTGMGRTLQVIVGSTYDGVQAVKVSSSSRSASAGTPSTVVTRTAADNPCA